MSAMRGILKRRPPCKKAVSFRAEDAVEVHEADEYDRRPVAPTHLSRSDLIELEEIRMALCPNTVGRAPMLKSVPISMLSLAPEGSSRPNPTQSRPMARPASPPPTAVTRPSRFASFGIMPVNPEGDGSRPSASAASNAAFSRSAPRSIPGFAFMPVVPTTESASSPPARPPPPKSRPLDFLPTTSASPPTARASPPSSSTLKATPPANRSNTTEISAQQRHSHDLQQRPSQSLPGLMSVTPTGPPAPPSLSFAPTSPTNAGRTPSPQKLRATPNEFRPSSPVVASFCAPISGSPTAGQPPISLLRSRAS